MINRTLAPPFISEPPIYDDFLDKDGKMTNAWVNWINSVTRIMGYAIVHDYIINPADDVKEEETPLLQAISLTTTNRNRLQNARNGTILYNETNNIMNFREGGSWVTFTAVQA